MVFSKLEPFGFEAMFYGHAMTTAMIANVFRKKGSKPVEPNDFMPQFKTKEQELSQVINFARMISAISTEEQDGS